MTRRAQLRSEAPRSPRLFLFYWLAISGRRSAGLDPDNSFKENVITLVTFQTALAPFHDYIGGSLGKKISTKPKFLAQTAFKNMAMLSRRGDATTHLSVTGAVR